MITYQKTILDWSGYVRFFDKVKFFSILYRNVSIFIVQSSGSLSLSSHPAFYPIQLTINCPRLHVNPSLLVIYHQLPGHVILPVLLFVKYFVRVEVLECHIRVG